MHDLIVFTISESISLRILLITLLPLFLIVVVIFSWTWWRTIIILPIDQGLIFIIILIAVII
jgi:hypothetical protein